MGEKMNHPAQNLIPMHPEKGPGMSTATITQILGDGYILKGSQGTVKARKAFSCLVEPEVNDTVLFAADDSGRRIIVAIVERPDRDGLTLSLPGGAQLNAGDGALAVTAPEQVSLASRKMHSFSETSVYKTREAVVAWDKVTATGSELQASYKTVRLISNLINTLADQVIDRFKGYVRKTRAHDVVQSGQMTRKADGLYAVDSTHTIMTSKEATKIDGDKLLMG